MNKEIINYLKNKPKEYEVTDLSLWDDEHISKGMLAAHLNVQLDSATRNIDFVKRSVDWITSFKGNKILDLGCGPGIYTNLFYEKGYDVVGIDFSKRSIEYAKEQNDKIKYLYQNYLDIDYNNEFDLVTLIFCDFGVLNENDRYILVEKIYKSLKDGGTFILDVFNSNNYLEFKEVREINYEKNGYWSTEEYVNIFSTFKYDNTYLEQYIILTNDNTRCFNLWNHAFSDKELLNFFKQFGFSKIELLDDVTGKTKSDNSPTTCIVLTK